MYNKCSLSFCVECSWPGLLIHSFNYSFLPPFLHSFNQSINQSLIYSFIHSFIHSLTPFIHSFIFVLVASLTGQEIVCLVSHGPVVEKVASHVHVHRQQWHIAIREGIDRMVEMEARWRDLHDEGLPQHLCYIQQVVASGNSHCEFTLWCRIHTNNGLMCNLWQQYGRVEHKIQIIRNNHAKRKIFWKIYTNTLKDW